jgi:hypothetical protein
MREWTRDCLHPAKNVRTETPHPQRHTSWRVIHPCTAMGTHRLQPTAGKHHCARITVYAKRDACSTAPPNHEALLNRPNSNSWRTHSRPTLHANDPANMAIDGDGRQTTCLQPRKGLSKQSLPLPPSNPDTRFFAFCFLFRLPAAPDCHHASGDLATTTSQHCRCISPAPCQGARLDTHQPCRMLCNKQTTRSARHSHAIPCDAQTPTPTATYHSACTHSCNESSHQGT